VTAILEKSIRKQFEKAPLLKNLFFVNQKSFSVGTPSLGLEHLSMFPFGNIDKSP